MGWHSDDEKALAENSAIASMNFGAERVFRFRHRQSRETIGLTFSHGSLLVMAGETQKHWLHCIPKAKKIRKPRINLTFRKMEA